MSLLPGGVVALASADLEVLLIRGDFDTAVPAVGVEVGGLVRDHVLAAKFVFDRSERARDVLHLEWEECPAASGIGQLLQVLVATQDEAAVIGRDRIYKDARALRHFNGLTLADFALIVFTVAKNNDRFADRIIRILIHELVPARLIDSIVKGRAAAVV